MNCYINNLKQFSLKKFDANLLNFFSSILCVNFETNVIKNIFYLYLFVLKIYIFCNFKNCCISIYFAKNTLMILFFLLSYEMLLIYNFHNTLFTWKYICINVLIYYCINILMNYCTHMY